MLPNYCGKKWWVFSQGICLFSYEDYTSFKSFLKLLLLLSLSWGQKEGETHGKVVLLLQILGSIDINEFKSLKKKCSSKRLYQLH